MTSTTRRRSASPANQAAVAKKAKVENTTRDITLPSGPRLEQYTEDYAKSTPYKHAVIGGLLSDDLLESVVEESTTYGIRGEEGSLPGWGWEQKETDIYKIQQTPDLSSLTTEHLPDETLAALPQLTKLKNALYSTEFRNFVRKVTGCGPLSQKKTDASVGLYTQGSHLLLHDDSISTRLVSYILYLPNSPPSAPSSSALQPSASGSFLKGWDSAWGGALELYPVENGEEVGLPGTKRSTKVDVSWGQIIFFEVQPGRSYHAVEEVIVGDGRQRLGVSGWFHRPVEGEEGYQAEDVEKAKADLSSLAQITSAPSAPFTQYTADPPVGLTSSHLAFLKSYLAPSYFSTATLEKLSGQFGAASEIVLHNFLHPELASNLKSETKAIDDKEYPKTVSLVSQDLGEGSGWALQGPTSKHRYLSLGKKATSTSTPVMSDVLDNLLPSEAFRAWLSVVSSLAPTGYRSEARRFRKGLDYTLAAGEDRASGEARLDVVLGATWWADVEAGSDEEDKLLDEGGWECYIASPEEGEDPAVFQSKLARQANGDEGEEDGDEEPTPVEPELTASSARTNGENEQVEEQVAGGSGGSGGRQVELEIDPSQLSPSDFDSDSDSDDDEDDGPLLTQAVSFNKLMIVLRDPGVMRFVKYLGAGAGGSRWDVGGEWEVGVLEEDEDEDEEGSPPNDGVET